LLTRSGELYLKNRDKYSEKRESGGGFAQGPPGCGKIARGTAKQARHDGRRPIAGKTPMRGRPTESDRAATAALLAEALAHHRAGRTAPAERLYRILAAEPARAGTLHLLGLLAHEAGRAAEAVELIGPRRGAGARGRGCALTEAAQG
jgi:hypothetical protein